MQLRRPFLLSLSRATIAGNHHRRPSRRNRLPVLLFFAVITAFLLVAVTAPVGLPTKATFAGTQSRTVDVKLASGTVEAKQRAAFNDHLSRSVPTALGQPQPQVFQAPGGSAGNRNAAELSEAAQQQGAPEPEPESQRRSDGSDSTLIWRLLHFYTAVSHRKCPRLVSLAAASTHLRRRQPKRMAPPPPLEVPFEPHPARLLVPSPREAHFDLPKGGLPASFFELSLNTPLLLHSTAVPLVAPPWEPNVLTIFLWSFYCTFDAVLPVGYDIPGAHPAPPSIVVAVNDSIGVDAFHLTVATHRIDLVLGSGAAGSYAVESLRGLVMGPNLFPRSVSLRERRRPAPRSSAGTTRPSHTPRRDDGTAAAVYVLPVAAGVTLKDRPEKPWRGLLVDIARHFRPLPELLEILWWLKTSRLNVLHLHLSDDQGFRLDVANFCPALAAVGGRRGSALHGPSNSTNKAYYEALPYNTAVFLTASDLKILVESALWLGISVIPEVDLPAHTAALIRAAEHCTPSVNLGVIKLSEGCSEDAYEKLPPGAPTCMGGTHGIVVPTSNIQIDFLVNLLVHIVDMFGPSLHVFHLGGDEAEKFRDKTYRIAGLGRKGAVVQARLLSKVAQRLAQERPQITSIVLWDESFLSLDGKTVNVSSAVKLTMQWWRDWSDEARPDFIQDSERRNAKGLGHIPIILSPASRSYLDLYQVEPHSESKFVVQGGTVSLFNTWSLGQLSVPGALGVEGCMWSETFNSFDVFTYQLLPRLWALSESAWSHSRYFQGNVTALYAAFESRAVRLTEVAAEAGLVVYQGPWYREHAPAEDVPVPVNAS